MDRLDTEQFTYKKTKDDKLFVFWNGKQVRTYTGRKALELISEIESAETERDVQYALARVTGNFKRGNERSSDETR
jgi:hypothetical protein